MDLFQNNYSIVYLLRNYLAFRPKEVGHYSAIDLVEFHLIFFKALSLLNSIFLAFFNGFFWVLYFSSTPIRCLKSFTNFYFGINFFLFKFSNCDFECFTFSLSFFLNRNEEMLKLKFRTTASHFS